MNGKQISQVNLMVTANTSGYSKELTSAKQQAASDLRQMGSSVISFRNVATKELTTAGKAAELLTQKNKLVIASLKDTSEVAKTQLRIVTDQYKQVQKAAEDELKTARTSIAEKKRILAEDKENVRAYIATLEKRSQAEGKVASSSVNHAERMSRAFKGMATEAKTSSSAMQKSFTGLSGSLQSLAISFGAVVTVGGVKRLLDTTSTYNTLNQRIKTATKETGDYAVVQERLYKMAIKNGAQMQDTVQVFQGLARSARELGASNQQMLTLTNTMQQLGVISGASAGNMSAGLQQFSQAMAGGVVRAEEWNSIVENIPEVAQRIAKGLGLSIGQTRQLMLDGKLLSKEVFDVLLKQSKDIDKEFQAMPRSMQQAYSGLETQFGKTLTKIDSITNATKLAVSGIDLMTAALERMGKEIDRPVGFDGQKGDNKSVTVRGIKTDQKHANQAGLLGFGRGVRDGIANFGDLVNPFTTPQEVAFNAAKRKLNRNELIENELRLGPPEPASKKQAPLDLSSMKVDEKAVKKHAKDVQNAEDLLASMRAQNAELEAKLKHDDESVTKEKALLKLSKDRTLTDAERNKYAKEINVLAAQHAVLKRQEEVGKEKEKLGEILASHKEKIELLKNELSGETETNSILTAQKEIRNAVKVGMKETAEIQQKIRDAAKEEAVLRDGVKLKAIADSMRSQLDSTKAKNDAAAELVPILQAEEQIRKNITAGMDHNVAAQKEIRDLAKQQADEILAKQYEADSKKIGDMGKSLEDENEKLKLKLQGQEDSAKFLEAERDVRRQIEEATKKTAQHIEAIQNSNMSEQDKSDRIGKVQDYANKLQGEADGKIQSIRQQTAENTRLNKALDDQEQIIKNIKDGTSSYKQKLADLAAEYSKGNITQKQWQKTADELWKTQTKASHTVGDAVKQMGNNLAQAIMSGTKLTDVFKNMGKTLVALAAQKLLFEPLANGLDNLSSKLFGTGKYTQKPVMPGSGGQLASSGANSMLGNAVGGAYGGGNLSTGNANSFAAQNALDIAQQLGLKQFAEGGSWGGGLALVGERGPEIVYSRDGGYVQNNQDMMSMFGAYGMSGRGSSGGDRYSAALSEIGGYQRQLQSGLTQDGHQLGYWDRQELSQKVQDKYKYTMNWNTGDERMLAQVSDDMARAQARAYLANPTKYNGVVNDNEYQRMSLRATYGTGSVDVAAAGGRVSWGAGDQMKNQLLAARAQGVSIPQELLDKAGFDASNWANSQATFNPMGNMDPFNWIGRGSYHSQGMGAGEGNTNNGAVYGGDFWDKNSGANGSERMDAMGGKDFMWRKFHGASGNGYEGVSDMWGYTHSAAHNQGRDFVGWDGKGDKGHRGGYVNEYQPQDSWVDADGNRLSFGKNGWLNGPDGHYTKGGSRYYGDDQLEYLNPSLEEKMKRQRREAYDMTHPPVTSNAPPIPRSGYQDMIDSGTYVPKTNGDMMDGLDNLRNRSSRPDGDFSDLLNAKQDAKAAKAELKRIKEEAKLEARNTKKYGANWRELAGDYSRSNGTMGGFGGLEPEAGSANNSAAQSDEEWMRTTGSTMDLGYSKNYKRIKQAEQLQKITSSVYGVPNGGAVGGGRLSTSNDVFDQQQYGQDGPSARMNSNQRMNSQYSNFADGFDGGYFGVQTGAYSGATAPKDGWQIKGIRQGIRAIKGYAEGGIVPAGELALVGEKGPELIVPSTAGRVIPNDRISTGGGAPVITLVNNTGLQMAAPEVRQNSDGSIGLFLNAAGANAARGGAVSRGTKQAGRSVNR